MYSVLLMLLENSIFAAALFAGVLLIKKIFRRKLSAGMHYILWGIVLLKLILPMQLSTEISPWNLLPQQAAAVQAITQTASSQTPEYAVSQEKTQSGNDVSGTQAADYETDANKPAAVQKTYEISWQDIVAVAWIFGMAAMVSWFAYGVRRLRKSAKNTCPSPGWAKALFEKCKAELNIKRRVRLSVESICVPAVRGVFFPVVILPVSLSEKKDEEGMRLIILHELMHIKRGDMAATYILNIINVIYWFNPVVWLMAKLISADMETACDASVLRVLGAGHRQPYIKTLVSFAGEGTKEIMQPSLSLSDSGVNMKRRIEGMFLDNKTRRPVKAAVTLFACLLAAVCFTSACVPAAPGSVNTPNALKHYTASAAIKSDYNVTVNFDADVEVPDVTKYPVYTIDLWPGFSDEQSQTDMNYLFGGEQNRDKLNYLHDYENTYTASGGYYQLKKPDGSKSRLMITGSGMHYDSNELNKTFYSYSKQENPDGVKMTKDEAVKAGQQVLGAMGIDNTKLYDVRIDNVSRNDNSSSGLTKIAECWTLKYYRTFGGITLSNFSQGPFVELVNEDYDSQTYYKTGNSEIVSVSLDDSGLLAFDWSNPVAITGTMEDNPSLLPFEDIIKIARSKMYYKVEAESDAGDISYYDAGINISSIKLSYNIVMNKDMTKHIMIPVWNFVGNVVSKNTIDFKMDEAFCFFTIDAVNGSVISDVLTVS